MELNTEESSEFRETKEGLTIQVGLSKFRAFRPCSVT